MDSCWYGRAVLLFSILVKTDQKDREGRSVLKECNCTMIDCLYDYVGRWQAISISSSKFVHLVDLTFYAYLTGESPTWWSQTDESGTKLLYQPEPDPLICILPVSSVLGMLPLVPAGYNRTIPAAMRNSKSLLSKYGECYKDWHPGSGSRLYYINQWAVCWPSDHLKRPLTGWAWEQANMVWLSVWLREGKHNANHNHTNFTNCKQWTHAKQKWLVQM